MRKYLDIKGCSMVDGKGRVKGLVEDCIFDKRRKVICSFLILGKGLLTHPYILPFFNLQSVGDVIVYKGELYEMNKNLFNKKRSIMLNALIDKEIIDENGNITGSVKDLIIDECSGAIRAIVCSNGFIDDIFDGRRIVMIDERTVLGSEKIIAHNDNIDIHNDISFKKFTRG